MSPDTGPAPSSQATHVQRKEWLMWQSDSVSQPIATYAVDSITFSQKKDF